MATTVSTPTLTSTQHTLWNTFRMTVFVHSVKVLCTERERGRGSSSGVARILKLRGHRDCTLPNAAYRGM